MIKGLLKGIAKEAAEDIFDEYSEDFDPDEYEEAFGIPFGCSACGGDYPNCRQGCSLFDDD